MLSRENRRPDVGAMWGFAPRLVRFMRLARLGVRKNPRKTGLFLKTPSRANPSLSANFIQHRLS